MRAAILIATSVLSLHGQVSFPDAKPVPRMQATPLPDDQVAFERDGKEIARFHYGPQHERPFVYPVIGPADVQVASTQVWSS